MYLVKIEPVYSQGVGWFDLITDNTKYVKLFLNELDRYKNYLKDNELNVEEWEFYEYVFKLDNIDYVNNKCGGYCIYKSYYIGDQQKNDVIIDYNKQINEDCEYENFFHEYENFELKINYVYNWFDCPSTQIHISNFDIIGKNYLK